MFEISHRILYSEIDRTGHLSMNGLLRIFQDIGYSHALIRNVGIEYTKKSHLTWYLLSWEIYGVDMPMLGQEVKILTNFYDLAGPVARKSIVMYDLEGNALAFADTMWVFMDIAKQEPTEPEENMWPEEDFGEKYPMPKTNRRIRTVKKDGAYVRAVKPFAIKPYILDTNMHANNTKLCELAMELCDADNGCTMLRAEFKNQVKPGSVIHPFIEERDTTVVALKSEDGSDYAVFEFAGLDDEKFDVIYYGDM